MRIYKIAETITAYRGDGGPQRGAIYAVGTHYSTRKEIAELYGDTKEYTLNLNKPYIIPDASKYGYDYMAMIKDHFHTEIPDVVTKVLLNNGYDSLIIGNAQVGQGSREYPSSEIIVLPSSFELSDQLKYMSKYVLENLKL